MPELPEVQTVVNDLLKIITDKEISRIEEYYPKTLRIECEESNYCSVVATVERRGKYILILLTNGFSIIVHLRMTGKLIYEENEQEPLKHERARIYFTDDSFLRFDDVRTFGTIDCLKQSRFPEYFSKLGIEPLSSEFTYDYLRANIKNITSPIKSLPTRPI